MHDLILKWRSTLFAGVVGGAVIGCVALALLSLTAKKTDIQALSPALENAPAEIEHPISALPPPPASAIEPAPVANIAVEVRGAVRNPGVYRFAPTDRVQDGINRAGGLLDNADLSDINVAAYLLNGTALWIPAVSTPETRDGVLRYKGAVKAAATNPPFYTRSGWRPPVQAAADEPVNSAPIDRKEAGSPGAAYGSDGKLNLNKATQHQLEDIPGIGPRTAEKIITYRAQTPFQNVDDLTNVQGIGQKKLDAIRSLVTVE